MNIPSSLNAEVNDVGLLLFFGGFCFRTRAPSALGCFRHRAPTLQLPVLVLQGRLTVVFALQCGNMQRMVVHSRETSRENISGRLSQLLDRLKVQDRGRPAYLQRALVEHGVNVTHQATRKWLEGTAVPDLEKLCAIAVQFNVSMDWLALGRGPMFLPENPLPWPFSPELYARFERLSAAERVEAQAALHSRIIRIEEGDDERHALPAMELLSADLARPDRQRAVRPRRKR